MPQVGPYSRPDAFAKIDGRTREAKLMRATRAELIAHVGGKPSATQRALIDRAVNLTLQMALLDAKSAGGKAMTEHDSRTYLAWCNTLTRLMRQLGLHGVREKAPTVADHRAARAGVAA